MKALLSLPRISLFRFLLLVLLGGGSVPLTQAQTGSFFPTEPSEFISAYGQYLEKSAKESAISAAEALTQSWNTGGMSPALQDSFILTANALASSRIATYPTLTEFTETFLRLDRQSGFADMPPADYLVYARKCIRRLSKEETAVYIKVINQYTLTGVPSPKSRYAWTLTADNPQFGWKVYETLDGQKEVPLLEFGETDLIFALSNGNDSTHIRATQGAFFPLSMTFRGEGGRVNWAKVELPAEDVYCDLGAYRVNLNYAQLKVDTVSFVYRGLVDEPLKGRFEDRNMGHPSPERAKYPLFQSYEGGIVISSLVPDVVYEGGFTLRGQRKVGTAFWGEVAEVEPEPMQGEEAPMEAYDEFGYDTGFGEETYEEPDWNALNGFDEGEDADQMDESFFGVSESEGSIVGMELKPARLSFLRGGRTVMSLKGQSFSLDTALLKGDHLEVSLYPSETDSIYHPEMKLRYKPADSLVILEHPVGSARSGIPFVSSYHEYALNFETMAWDLALDELRFLAQLNQSQKYFSIQSFDFFNPDDMRRMKGVMRFNPVGAIYRYQVKVGGAIFPEEILRDFGVITRKDIEDGSFLNDLNYRSFVQALPRLENEGFLTYDRTTKEIFPLPKLAHWSAAARKKKDYDVIRIYGQVISGPQARMDLSTMELQMLGVSPFPLSDSVYVAVKAKDEEIYVQEDRNLRFEGTVDAGRLRFFSFDPDSLHFSFSYDDYRILCDNIDSLRFNLSIGQDGSQGGISDLQRALENTVFENVTGVIHISAPNNKSGTKGGKRSSSPAEESYYAKYPVFDSYGQSFIYWDDPKIRGGVYHRDSIQFAVNPFVLDSLEDFDPNNLSFTGDFYSAEVLPTRQLKNQQLEVMSDFSLGFTYETTEEDNARGGLPIYGRKGKFIGTITLDGGGLQGSGKMDFGNTIAESDSFVFYLDSVQAPVRYFSLKRGFKNGFYFPEVEGDSAFYTWYTRDTVLKISSRYNKALTLFEGEAQFEGELSVKPGGMFGDGVLTVGQVQVESDSLIFRVEDFDARHAEFRIVDENDPSLIHFSAKDAHVAYDIRKHQSTFVAQDLGRKQPHFPSHQFQTSLGQGVYNRDKGTLALVGVEGFERDNFFSTTNPEQEGLEFLAADAKYLIDSMRIEIRGVPNVQVADAVIKPPTEEITIQAFGVLDTIKNAEVMAGRDTLIDERTQRQHRIYEADIQIASGRSYSGGGKYDYNFVENIPQDISFNNIEVNEEGHTIASGEIRTRPGFYLTERIFFRGTAELDASRRFLSFEGDVRIESDNPVFQGEWFTFAKTVVNPDTVIIPIDDDILEGGGDSLVVGLLYASEDERFYSRFLQEKEFTYDKDILMTEGGLTFDTENNAFRIGNPDKLAGRVFRGPTVSFNDSTNKVTSDGYLRFPGKFKDKTLSVTFSGAWTEDVVEHTVSTDLIMAIDFGSAIPEDVLNKAGGILHATFPSNEYVDLRNRPFVNRIAELLEGPIKDAGLYAGAEKKTRAYLRSVAENTVSIKAGLAESLPYSLLLSGVDFQYNEQVRALYCDTEVGLLGMAGAPYYQKVQARIVYKFGGISLDGDRESDRLTVYLKFDRPGYSWIYWRFDGETLQTVASTAFDESYTKGIETLIRKRKNESGYRVVLVPQEEAANFDRDFNLLFGGRN